MDSVQRLIALAWQFGPFAFAIVFVFLVSRQCNSQYLASVQRLQPVAAPAELWMYRTFFILTFLIGCGLSIYSVYWWAQAQQKFFVYDFRISGVGTNKKLLAVSPVILKSHPIEQDDGTLLYEFVVIKDGPFHPGQKFSISIVDDTPDKLGGLGKGRTPLNLSWNGQSNQQFRIISENDIIRLDEQ